MSPRSFYAFWFCLAAAGFSTACTPIETGPTSAEAITEAKALPRYSARAFFENTSFRMPSPGPYAFTADSSDLLLSSDETGVYNAWRLDVSSGERTPLTSSTGAPIYALSWFPDGERFLYTQDGGGDELTHVFVQGADGEPRDLTPGEKLKAGFAGWLANGEAFYVSSNERDPAAFDLYRYDSEDYERELIFENSGGFNLGSMSRDGRWLALSKVRSNADSNIFLIDLAQPDPEPKLITPHEGDISHSDYTFTPDSKKLVYATNAHGEFNQAWTYDIAAEEHEPLISKDWDVLYVSYSPSGRYRVSGINRDARTEVNVQDEVSGKELSLPPLPDGDLAGLRFDRDEKSVVFALNGDTAPPDVFAVPLNGGQVSRLTRALNPEIDSEQLVEGEVLRFVSYDGLEVPGILYRPREASKDQAVPALVFVHGGPGGQSRKGYRASIQHLVNHGYAVFAINNRGSSGYGKTFFHLDDKRHGEADLGDVVASRDFLADLDWIDGERIGIYGGSYGGYMVAAALAFKPEVFQVGVNVFGVTNWVRTLKSMPEWWGPIRSALYAELGDPATDEERLQRISPLFHTDNIVRPLLVVQGANDPRVLQVESDELVDNVRANGVPVEYVLFEDEGHGFRRRENRITASEAYLRFLDRYLKGTPAAG
ncbi:MAG: alpha/beta fold hydrolase [Pseudomonadota bacterium]